MQRVEKCAYQAVPYPLLVLAAHILGFLAAFLVVELAGPTKWTSLLQPTVHNLKVQDALAFKPMYGGA